MIGKSNFKSENAKTKRHTQQEGQDYDIQYSTSIIMFYTSKSTALQIQGNKKDFVYVIK